MQDIRYQKISSSDLSSFIQDLASLRIRVFREFPYLYKGSEENERRYLYLDTYVKSHNFCLFAAFDGPKMVGATTFLPMEEESPEIKKPFIEAGLDLMEYTYFGESVLLPEYRGAGIGNKFFSLREAQAILFNTRFATFCAVDRPADHPLRPKDHRFLDPFWEKTGFRKREDLKCQLEWEELPDGQRKSHSLTFWVKQL